MNYFKIAKFFLYLAPFTVAIVSASTLFPFIVGKYVWFRSVVDLAFLFFLLGLLLHREAKQYETRLLKWIKLPLAIAVGAFTVTFVLAGFFGVNPQISFWANFERGEGGLQILHLYLFFILLGVLLKDKKDWKKIFLLSVFAGLFMILYGIGAGLKDTDAGIKSFIGPSFKDGGYRFQGSIGNPAYVATYLIFMIFYVAYLIATSKNKLFSPKNIIRWVPLLLFLAFFVLAGTRGAFIGLLVAMFLGLFYLAYAAKKWRRRLLILAGLAILGLVLIIVFKNTAFVKKVPVLRIFDISFSARTFEDRTYIWQAAAKGFKERPILGWGPENFAQVFDRNFPTDFFTPERGFGAWFDRAHSIFFDYLVETGVLGLLSYLSIFVVFYIQFFAQTKREMNQTKSAASDNVKNLSQLTNRDFFVKFFVFVIPLAYLIQGLVLFEVLVIYLNLFLFLGFVNYEFNEGRLGKV